MTERSVPSVAILRALLLEELAPPSRTVLVYGRSEPDDGAIDPTARWFPLELAGTLRADTTAVQAEYLAGQWRLATYERGQDGLWRCRWPYRRALDRLANRNVREAIVLWRLLDGSSMRAAWRGFRMPLDPKVAVIALLRTVRAWAEEEREAEYERRPGSFPRRPAWIDKSESQQRAEGAS